MAASEGPGNNTNANGQLVEDKGPRIDTTRIPIQTIAPLVHWDDMAIHAHRNSCDKGFWHQGEGRNQGEMVALMHSELSELLEAIRDGNPESKKIPGFSQVEEELADEVIRIMDFSVGFGHRVWQAVLAKHAYNVKRPHMHGRQF